MNQHWIPLLDGDDAKRAWRRIDEIEAKLLAATSLSPDLFSGDAGLALFHAYHERAKAQAPNESVRCVERAVAALADSVQTPSLYAGFTGIAFAAAHLGWGQNEDGEAGTFAAVDEALLELCAETPWTADYDLVAGLVGFGVYALERMPDPTAARCLAQVVQRLDETAERKSGGRLSWWTRPELIPPSRPSRGEYNLGLAHGMPGVVAMLGQAAAAGVERARCHKLLEGLVAWLREQRVPEPDAGRAEGADGARGGGYPAALMEGVVPRRARTAWCYGDPGVAVGSWVGATGVDRADWVAESIALARSAATRPSDQCGVQDAGLCHGSAGLGHIYNRLRMASGDDVIARAARHWLLDAIERPLAAEPGLLEGAAGVGLALLAAVSNVAPEWDRVMLLSGWSGRAS
jgi:lantibiotic modifying enzyme